MNTTILPKSQRTRRPIDCKFQDFRVWLKKKKRYHIAPTKDAISRCRRVEKAYGISLENNGCKLLNQLILNPEKLFGSKIPKSGIAPYKTAVRLFMEFIGTQKSR